MHVFVCQKAQTYSALFRGIQQQREQQLNQLRHRHGNYTCSSPSSTYISDDDDEEQGCDVTAADLDLVHCADLDRLRSAPIDTVSHI